MIFFSKAPPFVTHTLRGIIKNAVNMPKPLFRASIDNLIKVQREIIEKRSKILVKKDYKWSSDYRQRVKSHNDEVQALLLDEVRWKEADDALRKVTANPG